MGGGIRVLSLGYSVGSLVLHTLEKRVLYSFVVRECANGGKMINASTLLLARIPCN